MSTELLLFLLLLWSLSLTWVEQSNTHLIKADTGNLGWNALYILGTKNLSLPQSLFGCIQCWSIQFFFCGHHWETEQWKTVLANGLVRKTPGRTSTSCSPGSKHYTPERDARGYEWPSRFRPPWSQLPPASGSLGLLGGCPFPYSWEELYVINFLYLSWVHLFLFPYDGPSFLPWSPKKQNEKITQLLLHQSLHTKEIQCILKTPVNISGP